MSARTGWRWFRAVGGVLVVVASVEYGVVPHLVETRTELSLVTDMSPVLLVIAVLLEIASLAAYTGLTQVLMASSGPPRLTFGTQWRVDLTGYGLSHVLPGGGASAAAVRYRLMVARGVNGAVAASLAAVQTVLAILGLVVVWLVGSILSLPRTGVTTTTVVLVAAAGVVLVVLQHLSSAGARSWREGLWWARLTRIARAVPLRWRSALRSVGSRMLASFRDPMTTRTGVAWSSTNWLLDAVCLWVCLRAYGTSVPPELVLAGYGLANFVGLIPLTPGGLGIIEGLLVPTMVAAGAAAGPAVLGVLTWRLLQFWLPVPVALACWASLRTRRGEHRPDPRRRPGRPIPPAAGETGTLDPGGQVLDL